MNYPFLEFIHQALKKQGATKLKAFWRERKISFSYEYLRQIFQGTRIPSPDIVEELAAALEVSEKRLRRLAAESKFETVVREHYLPGSTTSLGTLAEKTAKPSKAQALDQKILRLTHQLLQRLGPSQKQDLAEYLKFLKQQWRRQSSQNLSKK